MLAAAFFASFLTLAQDPLEPAPATPFDRVLAIEIDEDDAVLAGHGRAQRIEYVAEFSGSLHLWTRTTDEVDLFLRVESTDGVVLGEDSDSGGGTTPYLRLDIEPERELVIFAAIQTPEGEATASLELCAMAAPETAETRDHVREANAALGEVKRLRGARELDAARSLATSTLAELGAVPGADVSGDVCKAALQLAAESSALADLPLDASVWRLVHRYFLRVLPPEHSVLLDARFRLANAIGALGDLRAARPLFEQVFEARSRTLGPDDLDLQQARQGFAAVLARLGEVDRARDLFEQVLEVLALTLPDDHPALQAARLNVGAMASQMGDYEQARPLFEKVLEVRTRTLPDDHAELQATRRNLGLVLSQLGDPQGARVLFEKVLEVRSRTLPPDHPDLQLSRLDLAGVLRADGEAEDSRLLVEQALEVFTRTLPPDHGYVQVARNHLALVSRALGDFRAAQALFEQVLEVHSRLLPEEHPSVQTARLNLATSYWDLGDLEGARSLRKSVLDVFERTLPDDHPDLQKARISLALNILAQFARDAREHGKSTVDAAEDLREVEGLLRDLARASISGARKIALSATRREAEERCATLAQDLDTLLAASLGQGSYAKLPDLAVDAFALSEATRNGGLTTASLMRMAEESPRYDEVRDRLRRASSEVARLAHSGATSDEFRKATSQRDAAERELVDMGRELARGRPSIAEIEAATIGSALAPGDAVVAFRRFVHESSNSSQPDESGAQTSVEVFIDSLCAFVVQITAEGTGTATHFWLKDLGPIEPIEDAVVAWRDALGTGDGRGLVQTARPASASIEQEGEALRELLFDPLVPALADSRRIVLVLDDLLHLVPFDALPAAPRQDESQRELLGHRYRLEVRNTLGELFDHRARALQADALVVLGEPSFDLPPEDPTLEDPSNGERDVSAEPIAPRTSGAVAILRGSFWESGFDPLPYTGVEARELARLHEDSWERASTIVLAQRDASRAAIEALAPSARWLHLATHGWYASESIRSWSDRGPLDAQSGFDSRMSSAEQVQAMSPMLLCGLALAGANLPDEALGRTSGLMTADEVSMLDLSNCELAVLSACDTNVGVRRAGQGVASLQKALQMAGARSVVTSLWKVPDEATKDLMLDFYRRMWVEEKPKWRALWEAKMRLRDARDEHGDPLYTTRDWAAWVLTGEQD